MTRRDRPQRKSAQRCVSGMQATSESLHIGNYVGALRSWIELQGLFDAFYFVADLHALTVPTDPELIRRRTRVTATQFIDGGVRPARSSLVSPKPCAGARRARVEHELPDGVW